MEAVSLGLTIATLFTTCIECFEYFKAAKGCEQRFEILLVKLEWQQERLLVWGDLAGVGDKKQLTVGPITESEYRRQLLTKRCLDQIHQLLGDGELLKTKYGLRAGTASRDSAPLSGISSNALKRFRLRLGRQSQGPGVLDKTRWAIHKESKFSELVQDIRDLIDGLMIDAPVSPEMQDQKVQDDIASMVDDIQSLHLFQEACKDDYLQWWTAASAAIDASDVATVDNQMAEERLQHYGTSNRGASGISRDGSELPIFFGDRSNPSFFVLTESCRAQDSETPCDQIRLGTMSVEQGHQYSFIAPGSVRTRSAPGYRIMKYVDPSKFTYADLDTYIESTYRAISSGESLPDDEDRYHVTVYIYCPPCTCQIATALDICEYRYKNNLVDCYVRIDHRQDTCCSASAPRTDGLLSVINYLKDKEKGTSSVTVSDYEGQRLKLIDREWLERQIYEYSEGDQLASLSPEGQLARIAEFHKGERSCAAIIILGEADYCVPLMTGPPFRSSESGQFPRETYLYRNLLKRYPENSWNWEREYLGTYSSRAPLPPKRPAPIDSNISQTLDISPRGTKRSKSSASDDEDP